MKKIGLILTIAICTLGVLCSCSNRDTQYEESIRQIDKVETKTVEYTTTCKDCGGNGICKACEGDGIPGSDTPHICTPECKTNRFHKYYAYAAVCNVCNQNGICAKCNGEGYVRVVVTENNNQAIDNDYSGGNHGYNYNDDNYYDDYDYNDDDYYDDYDYDDDNWIRDCYSCYGTGDCSTCHGEGRLDALDGHVLGDYCRTCNGNGRCIRCNGKGVLD